LEYLRGYWLKNPQEYDRQGRIIFSRQNELRIDNGFPFDFNKICPSNTTDHWTNETLYLENIKQLITNTSVTPISSFFYKHGRFYSSTYPCVSLNPLEDSDLMVQIPPITFKNDDMKAVIVSYIDLRTLGKEIDREISKIDEVQSRILDQPDSPRELGFSVKHWRNKFTCDCESDCRFVNIQHVRVVETVPEIVRPWDNSVVSTPSPLPDFESDHRVSFVASTDYSHLRYDRLTKSFYTPRNEMLDNAWYVRSFVEKYMLREPVVLSPTFIVPISTRQRSRPIRKIVKRLKAFGPPLRRTLKKYQDEIFLGTAGGAVGLAILADAALIAGSLLK